MILNYVKFSAIRKQVFTNRDVRTTDYPLLTVSTEWRNLSPNPSHSCGRCSQYPKVWDCKQALQRYFDLLRMGNGLRFRERMALILFSERP